MASTTELQHDWACVGDWKGFMWLVKRSIIKIIIIGGWTRPNMNAIIQDLSATIIYDRRSLSSWWQRVFGLYGHVTNTSRQGLGHW